MHTFELKCDFDILLEPGATLSFVGVKVVLSDKNTVAFTPVACRPSKGVI